MLFRSIEPCEPFYNRLCRMRSDSSWSAERDTRAFLRGGRGDGPARASDGGAIRWTAAPDEVETPRVDVAIANARSRPSPGAVLVDFQRVRASRRPPTRAARTTTTAAATATTTTRVDPFDSLRCRSPARFTDECRRCALLRASATPRALPDSRLIEFEGVSYLGPKGVPDRITTEVQASYRKSKSSCP